MAVVRPGEVQLNLRLSEELAKRFRRIAQANYRTVNGELRAIIEAHVEAEEARLAREAGSAEG